MKIAVVTGASSGMGREFVYQIAVRYSWLDEIWVIARNRRALQVLKAELPDVKIRILALDITKTGCIHELEALLENEKPYIKLLVNAAGVGTQKSIASSSVEELSVMTELNDTALTRVTKVCLPYCAKKSRIFCIASAAAFVPQPGFAVYAASKAYVLYFARALQREVKKEEITVTAVCPGPVNTAFLEKMGGQERMPGYKKLFIAKPGAVVKKALKDGSKGKELSVYGISMKALRLMCKILPHGIVMDFIQK